MTHTVISIVAFLFVLAFLILVHEFGHFFVAKLCGVKVLRFSIGFGKKIVGWKDRSGTEYLVSMIPLGGYVKMLDETEGEVSAAEVQYAYNRKPVLSKMLIVIAGPFSNFLIAFFVLWLMFVIGLQGVVPIIGAVQPHSIAYSAGIRANQKILSVDEVATHTWHEVIGRILSRVGDSGYLKIKLMQPEQKTLMTKLSLEDWVLNTDAGNVLGSLGIVPKKPTLPPVIDQILDGSPAEQAGLRVNDHVLEINGIKIVSFEQLIHEIKNHPNQRVQLRVSRNDQVLSLTVVPMLTQSRTGKPIGQIGVLSYPAAWPESMLYRHEYSFFGAIRPAAVQTMAMCRMTLVMMGRMISGKLSWRFIGGPISIAKGVGISVRYGFSYFLRFLALISVSLGIINLLPIPVLDGGYLVYHVAEFIRGRPLSPRVQIIGIRLGLFFLILLMALALFNDLMRL